jgi:carbonic anhydrase
VIAMKLKTAAIAAILVVSNAMGADWKPIGSGNEKIDIDRSRIVSGRDGLVTVWSRSNTPQAMLDVDGSYNAVEALNRYDCTASRFVTLKRLYLRENILIRAERVLAPKEMSVAAGSVDALILGEVCKLATQSVQVADAVSPSMMAVSDSGHAVAVVADKPAADKSNEKQSTNEKTGAAPKLPRFITLPHIDPSQVQRPTDEPRQPSLSSESAAPKSSPSRRNTASAVKSEAAKAGVSIERVERAPKMADRTAREIALASTGTNTGPKYGGSASGYASARRYDEIPADVHQHKDIHWDYEGDGGPARWSKLRADYGLCESGQRQSPIDIQGGIRVDLEPIRFDYQPSPFRIIDNGHTVQVNLGEGNSIHVMGRTYRLVQLHFHRPAEERIDGHGFEMVVHLVHKDDEGHLAVVAVLLERGAEHPVIQTFWNNLPLETDHELAPATAIDPDKLLPETRSYYTYMGSLTTPPCSEGVLWMVMKQPQQLSPEQIAIFSRLYRNNARPIQASNGRLVKENR